MWALCDLPDSARNESGDPVDLTIHVAPGLLLLPVLNDCSVERFFPGGALRALLQLIHDFYYESVDAAELAYWMPRSSPAEQERLTSLLGYVSDGHAVDRLDVLGESDPQFLGIEEGVVLLGS